MEAESTQVTEGRDVSLTIPARPDHLVLARLALSAVCRLTPLSADEVADPHAKTTGDGVVERDVDGGQAGRELVADAQMIHGIAHAGLDVVEIEHARAHEQRLDHAKIFAGHQRIVPVTTGHSKTVDWPTDADGYYDVTVTADTGDGFTRRYAGRIG